MTTNPPQAPRSDAPPPGRSGAGTHLLFPSRDPSRQAQDTDPQSPYAHNNVHNVRITAPDLARRALVEQTRSRLLLAAGGFAILFGAVAVKLAAATVIAPMSAKRLLDRDRLPAFAPLGLGPTTQAPSGPDAQQGPPVAPPATPVGGPPLAQSGAPEAAGPHQRAMIVDRNGDILALSLPTSGLYANPKEMIDTDEAAAKLKQVIPHLDLEVVRARLASAKQFVYLARNITPREQLAVNNLGIPGVYFQGSERRRYPQGRVAAQVVGAVDVDAKGVAGVERFFDQRLRDDPEPLRLSLDVRVQAAVRDELSKSMTEFQAIGACGIVMDVRTGEVIAMVSLPDFDSNKFGEAKPEQRFNRAVTGMYEPGSTFKLQTAAMALDSGAAHLWSVFDAAHNIKIGRFTISDFEGKHRPLFLPEVIAYSSNLGAAHIAQAVGAERQRSWLEKMGMFTRIGIELPEQGQPIVQKAENWKEIATMTVGFGHGIAVSPLHVVRGTAAIANGGIVMRPTLLAAEPGAPPREGTRVMQQSTSDTLRKLMRLVVTDGYGKPADVPGYFVGGKTGTAEKTSGHGYKKHTNVSAFMSVFPMNAPRYAVYFMLDEPKGNKSTGGFSTAGAVSAPGAGRLIARIAPMLGLLPETTNAAAIQASLAIAMQPGRPANAPAANTAASILAHTPKPAPPSPAPTTSAPVSTPVALPREAPRQHEAALAPATAR